MKKYTIANIKPYLIGNFKIYGETKNTYFTNLKPINEANKDSLSFVSANRPDKKKLIANSNASIIIIDFSFEPNINEFKNKCLILVDDPKLNILKIGNNLFINKKETGIHPSAITHPEAIIGKNVFIGPNTYIGKAEIGENTSIKGNIYIYDNVKIGKNVTILPGCVIGSDGFGYIRNEKNVFENFPHIGNVIIEDNVEIGAGNCIDRGALGSTIIKKGSKTDNLVHIAHNVIVGEHCLITANVEISGSTVIGDNSYIAPSASFKESLNIGEKSFIGIGATVLRNIPANETWTGYPAMNLNKFAKLQIKLNKK